MPEVMSQDIGGAEIEYLHYPGDGPTVVMLHGTGFLPWLWHPIARRLAPSFRIVAPYFCDHRSIDPTDGGLGWLQLAGDLTTFIRGMGLEGSIIVGHSMGGTVASIAEALNSGIASKMVLVEPIFMPSDIYDLAIKVEEHPLAASARRRRNAWSDEAEARDYLRSKKLYANWDEEALELYLEHGMTKAANGGLTLACSPEREAALFMGGTEQNPWPLLGRIACPVLIVEGGESENRGLIDLQKAYSLIREAEFKVVPGAGHLIPMEKPRELLALIEEFLGAD
jgi:pimeloyl-ACP methyl ester carboxylesterase